MEKFASYLNHRVLILLATAGLAVGLLDHFQEYPRMVLARFHAPAQRPTAILSKEIDSDLEIRESLRLKSLHRTLMEEISAAEKKGYEVSRLRPIADHALALNTSAYRSAAFERLQKLRLAIPQSVEPFRPAGENEDGIDESAKPPARSHSIPKKRKRR